MLRGFIAFVLLFSLQMAQASLAPNCLPERRYMPLRMACQSVLKKSNEVSYSVLIHTRSVDVNCSGEYQNFQTAKIEFGTKQTSKAGSIELNHGTFTYSYKGSKSKFSAPVLNLELDCVTPMHGGFSVGN